MSSLKGEGLLEDELEELKEDREEYVEVRVWERYMGTNVYSPNSV